MYNRDMTGSKRLRDQFGLMTQCVELLVDLAMDKIP